MVQGKRVWILFLKSQSSMWRAGYPTTMLRMQVILACVGDSPIQVSAYLCLLSISGACMRFQARSRLLQYVGNRLWPRKLHDLKFKLNCNPKLNGILQRCKSFLHAVLHMYSNCTLQTCFGRIPMQLLDDATSS
eukprot:TRINITY_DN2219_c0_g1_i6.p1 TRINITY_DN2219_c0_g1~~TRINITY_DN2219_c0_g1_i6.p1  ORF type:complete len:134 (-),score=0.54 TRINITY_DN2219_c0_g1_i6:306-707(-)